MCLVPIFLAINPAKIFNSSEVVTQIIRLASSAPASINISYEPPLPTTPITSYWFTTSSTLVAF